MEKNNERTDRKIKVLFLLEAFDKGGIEQVTLDVVNNLDPNKYDITIQTFWYGGHCQSLVNKNIKVFPFFFKRYIPGIIRLIEYMSPKMLYKLFIKGDYDVEIAASDGGAAKVISGSTNKKSKKICWVHMDVIDQGSKLKEYQSRESARAIYEKFDKIICVSDNVKEHFQNKFGFEEKIDIMHNPIPTKKIQEKAKCQMDIQYDSSQVNIIAVGSLMKVKGFDRLIRVCGNLKKIDKLPVDLYIVGSGPLGEELNTIVKDNNYDNVELLGFRANPYPFIQNADLLVCSSYSEAYPTVIGESFVLGTPVLGTRCSGVCEWMEEDQSGLIVENDEYSLYEGIKKLLEEDNKLQEYKIRAEHKGKTLDFFKAMKCWENKFLV